MEEDFKEQLKKYRQEIDRIDQGLVNLLNERAVAVMKNPPNGGCGWMSLVG